jgi:flagellar hook-associated protein 2
MSTISVNTGSASTPINITGLASGIETSAIVKSLISAEKVPITRLTAQQEKIQAQQEELKSLQSSLQQLAFSVEEFVLPSLFETSQQVTSSESLRVAAMVTSGAAIGGYEVEVTQLASSAQRTFTFASPGEEATLTIDGREYTIGEGASAKELAAKINSDGSGSVYAAVLNSETIVLSNRVTGTTEGKFIEVSGEEVLTEKEGAAKEGRDAEYSIDGVQGISSSNTLTEAIPGVTLTLGGVTTTLGAVTVNVQAPAVSKTLIEERIQGFVKQYNKTVEEVSKQLSTKPLENASGAAEYAIGTLFGDSELNGLLQSMRATMYESVEGLPSTMSSPYDVGLGTSLGSGSSTPSHASVEGQISLEPSKLATALAEGPEAVQKMLQGWSKSLASAINNVAGPGGLISSRIESDETQITTMKKRITTMNEALTEREKSLVQTYAELEAALAKNNAQLSWLNEQVENL